ncbi:hypothetical protein CPB84DRAFT_1824288 [Gymnopilus junonius]|uniref:Uncharacterized protein n=1 Tax=Gymnopilus junonius TaxID=109634 RepID=A0A9P5TPS8_GYMJU|nr:hypothetical protein CPB84DRAFT_1824288 [Gymnopilus junonius]
MVKITNAVIIVAAVIPAFSAPIGEHRVLARREPKITSAQVNSFARGAKQITHSAKSDIECGAAVAPLFQRQKRDIEDLETRKFHITHSQARHAGGALASVAGFAKVLKGVGKVAGAFLRREDEDGDKYLREFDDAELEVREPKFSFGKVIKGVGKVTNVFIRGTPEIEELD